MPRRHSSEKYELAELDLFAGCSRQQLQFVASMTTRCEVERGRVLCHQGEIGQSFFVIVEGTASVVVDERTVATLGTGCGFGEVALLLPGGRRTATVRAATPMTVLVSSRPEFASVMAEVPTVARRVLHESTRRLAEASQRQGVLGVVS